MYIYIYIRLILLLRDSSTLCVVGHLLLTTFIYVYIYIYKDSNHKELPCLVIPLDNHW